jgi:hypothetical protein
MFKTGHPRAHERFKRSIVHQLDASGWRDGRPPDNFIESHWLHDDATLKGTASKVQKHSSRPLRDLDFFGRQRPKPLLSPRQCGPNHQKGFSLQMRLICCKDCQIVVAGTGF